MSIVPLNQGLAIFTKRFTHFLFLVVAFLVFVFCCRVDTLAAICENSRLSKFSQFLNNLEVVNSLKQCCVSTYNRLYPCDALEICLQTISNKDLWLEERKFRITGIFIVLYKDKNYDIFFFRYQVLWLIYIYGG